MFKLIPLGYYAFTGILNFITALALCIGVIAKNRQSKINRTFSLFALSVATWSIFYFIWLITTEPKHLSEFYLRTCMIPVLFMPALFFHFVIYFLNVKFKKRYITVNYILGGLFSLTVYTPYYAYNSERFFAIPHWLHPGIVFHFAISHFAVIIIISCYLLYKGFIKSAGIFRSQLLYVFIGTLMGFIGGGTNYFAWYRVPPMPPVLNFLVSVYMGLIGYAIIKYRLMDIKVVITRTGIFVAVYTLVLGIPFAIAVWAKGRLIDTLGPGWWMAPLGLMAVLASIGPFIYIYLERKAEESLLKEQKNYQRTLKQASMGMTRIRNLRKLLDLIAHIVTKTVKISYIAFYLYDKHTGEYVLELSRDKGRESISKLSSDNPLVSWIMVKREPMIYEEVKRRMQDSNDATYVHLEENMRLLTASVIIPCFLEDRFMGFFVLGDKVSGQIYSLEDLNVFQVLASQTALAIENARFYEEAKEMQEQIFQAEKMATIGTMANGLSHQINNRFYALSLIASDTIDTVKLTDTSKCTPEIKNMLDEINRALQRIQSNVMQGSEVVRGMLKYSRRQEDTFEPLELNKVLDNTLEMVQFKVKLDELDIVRSFGGIPKIKGNMAQLEEVFFNFIDNAYDAIVERRETLKEEGYRGRITVSAQAKTEDMLEVTIEDNGFGIRSEDSKKVFTPFFTTKTSSQKGTGLGLYVIRRIIEDTHKGKISFASEHKSGTHFVIELPIAK